MKSLPRRVLSLTVGAVVALAFDSPAQAQRACYVATIDEKQEVPPTGSPATGRGVFVLDRANLRLYYHITFSGLTSAETMAHLYQGSPGVDGLAVFDLGVGNPKTGVWNYPAAMDVPLASGGMYVSIHSRMFLGGEISGRIVPDQGSTECGFPTPGGSQEGPTPVTYCTGKTNSLGCVPFISVNGTPSVTLPTFNVIGNDHVPSEIGVLTYGFKKANLNFHGGKLCVKSPMQVVAKPAKPASAVCPAPGGVAGRLTFNFNAYIQSGADGSLTVGQRVYAQWRQRDPSDPLLFFDNLTDAVTFVIEQ